jgi:hypothetical protein
MRNFGHTLLHLDTNGQLPATRIAGDGEFGEPAAPRNERGVLVRDPLNQDGYQTRFVARGLSYLLPGKLLPSGSGAPVGSSTITLSPIVSRAVGADELMTWEDIPNMVLRVAGGGGKTSVSGTIKLSVVGSDRTISVRLVSDTAAIVGSQTIVPGSGTSGTATTVTIAATTVLLAVGSDHILKAQWMATGIARTLYCGGGSLALADAGGIGGSGSSITHLGPQSVGTTETAIAHGLSSTPNVVLITPTGPQFVWQSTPPDATHVFLTASAACSALVSVSI